MIVASVVPPCSLKAAIAALNTWVVEGRDKFQTATKKIRLSACARVLLDYLMVLVVAGAFLGSCSAQKRAMLVAAQIRSHRIRVSQEQDS